MERKKEIVDLIEVTLHKEGDMVEIASEIRTLKSEFVELVKKDHLQLQEKFISEGGLEDDFKPPHDELDGRFSDLMTKYNQKKKNWDDQRAHLLVQNLDTKKKIISDLEKLIEEEQHIGHAFEKFNELKTKWNNTGDVAPSEYRELQREYSHAMERFFYTINIYKTLKEYDLQKNLKLKTELTENVKALLLLDNIKEVRDLIGVYVNEWDEIGPTHQNKWEKVRDDFWESVRLVHKKIADHYQDQKEQQKKNLELKSELCDRLEGLNSETSDDKKKLKKLQKDIDGIRDEWKKIGFAGKGKNDQVWERFKAALSNVNKLKKEFFEEIKDGFKENEASKQKLIKKAEELKESVDWKSTAEVYKRLQSDWKRVGPTFPSKEQKLWKSFRAASDHFFAKRKEYFDGREDREKGNLALKKSLIKKLEDLKVTDGSAAVQAIEDIGKEWNAVGFVPLKEKNKIEETFQQLISKKLAGSGMGKHDVEEKTFELKIDGIKEADNSAELLRNEYQHLNEKLKKVESSIKQYENNLGFFGGNIEKNPLLKEVYAKIEASKGEASKLRARMELLEK